MEPVPVKAHIVVVEYVYYYRDGDQPTSTPSRFSQPLSSDEEPYKRRIKVGTQWQPLDTGWIKRASLLHLDHEPKRFTVNPSDEERVQADKLVIELAISTKVRDAHSPALEPSFTIRPGRSMRTQPVDLGTLHVRSPHGEAVLMVTAYPE